MARRTDNILGTLLVVAIGIAGAILMAHWAACEQYEGLCAMVALLARPIKPLAASRARQTHQATRADRFEQWPDTIATNWGSADAIGDDQAERSSSWGAIDETAAPEGGVHREPGRAKRSSTPSAGRLLAISVLCVAAIAAWAVASGQPLYFPLG